MEKNYQPIKEEVQQKTEKLIDKKRREGHVEITWHHKRRDNGTAKNNIRINVCEDEGTLLEYQLWD